MRKFFALLLTLALSISIYAPAVQADETQKSDDIVILYTNDVHTYIDGDISYDTIAALKKQLQTEYNHVLLVDAGDHIQGTAYGSMDKGKTIIDLMNAAGYDAATLGNHEFDYGMQGCINVRSWAAFPYISCNFYHEENGVRGGNVLDGYKAFTCGDTTVAFVGITTPESFTKTTPAYFQDENGNYIYGISGGEDGNALYSDVQTAIDGATTYGADYVIGLGHLGDDAASSPWTSEETIANVTGLDAFIDGHSHSIVEGKTVADKNNQSVLLTQTGEYFNRIGMMVIDNDTTDDVPIGTITTQFIELEDVASITPDAAVKTIKDAWLNEIDTQLGAVIGSAEVTLDNYDANGVRLVRSQETNSGDFCADALYYLFDNMDMDVDVAIINGGGIRNKAVTGDISYKTCKEIHTFGNVACLQTVTGQQLLDALEWGARTAGTAECGGFLQVSGITYKIDTAIESTVQMDDKGVWVGAPTGKYRVHDVKVYDKTTDSWQPLDMTATYNMAGYNYTLRDLGDGFAMFDGAVNVLDYVMEDYMVLANYVQGFTGGVVTATGSPLTAKHPGFTVDYGTVNGSGRITVEATPVMDDGKITIGGLDNNLWFTKYGNVYTDCPVSNFLGDMGFSLGDLVTVRFLDQELVLPVVPTFSYVDSGSPAIIATVTDTGAPTGYISMAINMGSFGETYGLAVKHTNDEGNWWWTAAEGVTYPVEVTFEMAEAEGYLAEYLLHQLTRTNERSDYSHLSDEQFANFREIHFGDLADNRLYRTSSPINPELGRNTYADAALKAAGVNVIMNLADSAEEAASYEGFADSYYAGQKVIYLNLGVDFASDDFKAGLARGLRFFAENSGTYAVHCTEGKDRAGFTSALLECLMGATYEEVVADYMTTYYNYYGVEKIVARSGADNKYDAIANSNIIKILCDAFKLSDGSGLSNAELLVQADLAAEATEYIKSLGLTDVEIEQLKENLSESDSFDDSKLDGEESSSSDETNDSNSSSAPNEESSKADESSKNEESSGSSAEMPDTGDHNNATAYVVIAVLSLVALAVITQKKKQYHK